MNLQNLYYFKKIAELENLSKASQVLNISQPSLSKALHNMEAELNAPLFDRIGKKIELNNNGKIMQKYSDEIITSMEKAKYEIELNTKMEHNILSVAFNTASNIIPNMVSLFIKKNPDIEIQFSNDIEEGPVICNFDAYLKKPKENSIHLLSEKCYLVFSKTHPLASKKCIVPSDLVKETFLYTRNCHSIYDLSFYLTSLAGATPHAIIECITKDAVYSFLSESLGIAIIPEIGWNLMEHTELVTYEFADIPLYRELYLTLNTPLSRNKNNPLNKFVDFCVDYFKHIHLMM